MRRTHVGHPQTYQQAFRELREGVDRDGLYDTRPSYYLGLSAWLGCLLLSSLYLTVNATGKRSCAQQART